LATLSFTGIRIGELKRLRKEDVDLVGGWICVESRKGAETKTRESRKIPIHPVLLQLLKEQNNKPSPWFFTAAPSREHPTGDHCISEKKINAAFKKVAERLGLDVGRKANGYVVHSLRHFFETVTINSRIPQRVVDLWTGHKSDKSMGRVYYTLTDEESQKFMSEVGFSLDANRSSGLSDQSRKDLNHDE
jgi:integrase